MSIALRGACGTTIPLLVDRWRSPPDAVERALLETLTDPVLDIGCGPGRLVFRLAESGRVALGIDPAPHAITESSRRGAPVLQRSVFDPLPGEGRWATALMLDGNIGIGGNPIALLSRVARLLRPDGEAIVEVDAPGSPTDTLMVRIQPNDGAPSPPFAWARVSADQIMAIGARAGMMLTGLNDDGGRWFARLRNRRPR